ncbi:MAG: NAD(P)/FAD-dependent oxidoreductase [Clostridia bacterium]|nr:NAD(P)/FAD-dependent oxidoreductase [Clostridia bacterium]
MKTIVVGGGPAGRLPAYVKAVAGNETVSIDQNENLGKKL